MNTVFTSTNRNGPADIGRSIKLARKLQDRRRSTEMKNKGFTVVELLIVIAVFGVIVVMVATISPAIAQKSKLNRAANELISDLTMAKQLASTENRYVAVDFSDDGKSYTIRKQYDIMYFDADPNNLDEESSWVHVKTAKPLDGDKFFKPEDITDFAFSSTGQVRLFDFDNPDPTKIELTVFIERRRSAGNMDLSKKIKVYPYGGIRIEE